MSMLEEPDPSMAGDGLRNATTVTPRLMAGVIEHACRRFPSASRPDTTARIKQMVEAQAWTDAALALIDLELPSWHIRRIAYDSGEWYCALSRQRELPDWLDQAIEARHPDLDLAILMAFIEAQQVAVSCSGTSVPAAPRDGRAVYVPLCADNLG